MSVRFVCDACGAVAVPSDETVAPSGSVIVTGPLPWAAVDVEHGREDLCQRCIHAFMVWRTEHVDVDAEVAGGVVEACSGDPP